MKACFKFMFLSLLSCSDIEKRQTQIIFENTMTNPVEVSFYPKKNLTSGNFYFGDDSETLYLIKSKLNANETLAIYKTTDYSVGPVDLLKTKFDSIVLQKSNGINIVLKSENSSDIYSGNSWKFKEENYSTPTQFRQNRIISRDFTYEIK